MLECRSSELYAQLMDHAGPLLFHSNDHLLPSRVSLRDRAAPDAEKDQSETASDAGGCRHTVRIIDKGGDEQRRAERNQQEATSPDRKSVVEGKSVSVSVDLGGRRIHKKTQHTPTTT